MKLLCIKNTKKLVKGVIYDATAVRTLNKAVSNYFRPTVTIFGMGTYTSNNFTNTDGTKIPEIDWKSDKYVDPSDRWKLTIRDVRILKKGDILKCSYGSLKFFEEGKLYEVSDILYKEEDTKRANGSSYKNIIQKIKIKGYNRWIDKNRFRELSVQEKRTISLGDIFGDKVEIADIEDVKSKRKIDRFDEKEKTKIIISAILGGCLDPYRNTLSIVDWAIQKRAMGYGINKDDIKPLLNKKLSDILKMLE